MSATELEERAAKAGLTMAEACRKAKVSRSCWQRWKQGKSDISKVNHYKLVDAIKEAEDARQKEQKRNRSSDGLRRISG